MVDALQVPDKEFCEVAEFGVPLGVSCPIPYTPLYPKYNPREYDPYPLLRDHRNYKSMEHPDAFNPVETLIEDEMRRGYIRELSDEESRDAKRTFVRRAAIPKGEDFSAGVRVIEDYRRNNVNRDSQIPNSTTLPNIESLRLKLGALTDCWPSATFKVLKVDLRSAYRAVGVREEERKHLSFTHSSNM
ncbi:hypothetical protein FOL47_005689, partial [Perkinsus chesapeaki]